MLREAREKSGMTLEEAARELRISPGYLHQIERGNRSVDHTRAKQIADLYAIERDALFVPIRFTAQIQQQ